MGGVLGLFCLVCLLILVFLGGVVAHRKQLAARHSAHMGRDGRISRTVRTRGVFFPDGFFEFLKPGARVRAANAAADTLDTSASDARRESFSTLTSEHAMSTLQRTSAVANQSDAHHRCHELSSHVDQVDGFTRGCSDSALSTDESQHTASSTFLASASNSMWSSQCALVPAATAVGARAFAAPRPVPPGAGCRTAAGAALDASSQPLLDTSSSFTDACGTMCSLNLTRIPPLKQMLEPDASFVSSDVSQIASSNRAHSLRLALVASTTASSSGSRAAPNDGSSSESTASTSSSPCVGTCSRCPFSL